MDWEMAAAWNLKSKTLFITVSEKYSITLQIKMKL